MDLEYPAQKKFQELINSLTEDVPWNCLIGHSPCFQHLLFTHVCTWSPWGNIIIIWSVTVLGVKVIGRIDVGNTRNNWGDPGNVLLSRAMITSTPLLITLVARLYLPLPSSSTINKINLCDKVKIISVVKEKKSKTWFKLITYLHYKKEKKVYIFSP